MTTWVLLADEGRARLMEFKGPKHGLEEIESFADMDAREDDATFRRDAHGRRGAGGTGRASNQTESAGEDKLMHEADAFARLLAERLNRAHHEGRFDDLRIAAAPRFLGLLRKQLDDEVRSDVVDEIDKDLLQLDSRSLVQRLFPPGSQPSA